MRVSGVLENKAIRCLVVDNPRTENPYGLGWQIPDAKLHQGKCNTHIAGQAEEGNEMESYEPDEKRALQFS